MKQLTTENTKDTEMKKRRPLQTFVISVPSVVKPD